MKIDKKFSGKWIAIKGQKIVASHKTLSQLSKKTEKMENNENFYYTLVPHGLFSGRL